MVTKTVNSIGMAIQNDLPFCIISFSPKNRADIFLYFIINGQEQHDVEYELNDSVLIINDYYEKYKFKIIEKTDRQIIINKNDKNYYLKRLLKYENNNFILSDDTVSFNQSKIDTIKTYKYVRPEFKGDLYDFFQKNIPIEMYIDTSYLINLTFTLKKSGIIDSINIVSDLISNNAIKNVLELTNNHWNVAKTNDKKCDSRISLLVIIKSRYEFVLGLTKPKKLIKKLFNEGLNNNTIGKLDTAIYYYSECEKLFDSYYTLQWYSRTKDNNEIYYYVRNFWISSIMNEATIFYQKGQLNNACEKWGKIALYDKEAYANYKKGCYK